MKAEVMDALTENRRYNYTRFAMLAQRSKQNTDATPRMSPFHSQQRNTQSEKFRSREIYLIHTE